MPRPKRHKIQQSSDSLNHLLQEIYNECATQRSDAIQQRNKILKEMEEMEDIAMVGKLTVDLLKIVDLAIDKKLALAKIQATLVTGGGKPGDTIVPDLSPDQTKFLRETMKKIKENKDVDA